MLLLVEKTSQSVFWGIKASKPSFLCEERHQHRAYLMEKVSNSLSFLAKRFQTRGFSVAKALTSALFKRKGVNICAFLVEKTSKSVDRQGVDSDVVSHEATPSFP